MTLIRQSITIAKDMLNPDSPKLISGKGSQLPGPSSTAALKTWIGRAFFAYAIPAIWSASGASPFIIDSGFSCGTIDPIRRYMMADAMHKSWACVDDKLYYLASPKGHASYCYEDDTKHPEHCTDEGFSALPGVEWLDGTSFGTVTLSDLITGSVKTYRANGNQNVDTSPDPGKLATANSLGHQDITAPGYIRMPVCSPAMALKAWFGSNVVHGPDTSAPGYPCVTMDSIGFCGASTFVDQTSGVSPLVSDCRKLVEKIQFRVQSTEHEVENAVGTQHQIEEYGGCRFGVEGNGKNGNIDFHIGGQDIIDIINDAIKMYGSSGRVGAKGNMNCKGTIKDQNVDWGLY
ncbi:chitinase [Metarhizium anisopliae]|nr:chitinase [Metarhizium anisopliae]